MIDHEALAYTTFLVDCGGCGNPIELGDADPTGTEIECDCGDTTLVTGAP